MKKTRREWLNELKPEHAKLAIENVIREEDESYLDETTDVETLEDAIEGFFIFVDSPQGGGFWHSIQEQIENGTYYQKELSFKPFKILIYLFILIAMIGVAYVLGHRRGFDAGSDAIRKSIIWENRDK
jgi:hypothetical protein